MREAIERTGLKIVRLYTYYTPISKGKFRLFQTALKLCRNPPSKIEATSKDGREFFLDLRSGMQESVYFLGEYEPAVTNVIRAVVRSGDVCLDVGANFGWFTTLFSSLSECGANAERMRSECGANAERMRSECGANAERMRSECGAKTSGISSRF